MKGFAITSKGLEETAALEIKELIGAKYQIEESCVIFDFEKFGDLCLLCYKAQSVDIVLHLIDSFEFKDIEDFEEAIEKINFGDCVEKCKRFKVECIRIGSHDFKSVDAEKRLINFINKKHKNIKFDLRGYEIIFFVYIVNNACYVGVDFSGFELNKRAYKIYLHPNSLRGTIAYALIRESGFQKGEVLLDPFSRDGIISIEAAFYANNFPVNYFKKDRFAFLKLELGIDYEKFFKKIDNKTEKKPKPRIYSFDYLFKFVDFSKKNAKIAGVDKLIEFSRTELEWLDIKFKKESVDRIVTSLPSSKNANLGKIYNEFFYQSDYILKKAGVLALITKAPDFVKKCAERHNFETAGEKYAWSGEQQLIMTIFKKKNI
ncbi:hypothetical protein HY637_06110 [Candidatus Woesearchaeota archaeon]|nr:hypothetical protein [Candidatus Pacearchaeota archaeon]MBI4452976.1 hypothetical protein [Candidatus Woesearchaeota archaeon]